MLCFLLSFSEQFEGRINRLFPASLDLVCENKIKFSPCTWFQNMILSPEFFCQIEHSLATKIRRNRFSWWSFLELKQKNYDKNIWTQIILCLCKNQIPALNLNFIGLNRVDKIENNFRLSWLWEATIALPPMPLMQLHLLILKICANAWRPGR